MGRGLTGSQLSILLILAGIIFIVVLVNLAIRFYRKRSKTAAFIQKERQKPTKFKNILHVAKKYNFTNAERDILWSICKMQPLPNFEYSINDPDIINTFFKTGYNSISSSQQESNSLTAITQAAGFVSYNKNNFEEQKALIISIKDKLEAAKLSDSGISSSTVLDENQELFYLSRNHDRYPVTLLENTAEGMYTTIPHNIFNQELKLEPLSQLTFLFQLKTLVLYQMKARLVRYETRHEKSVMLISHSNHIKALQAKEHIIIQLNIPCTFQPVQIISEGRKSEAEITYKPIGKKYTGTLVSFTGTECLISENMPIKINQYIYIEAQIEENTTDAVTGIISATSQSDEKGKFLLHVKYIRMSKATRNRILSRVYNFVQK